MVLRFEFLAVPSHHIGRFCLFSDFRCDEREKMTINSLSFIFMFWKEMIWNGVVLNFYGNETRPSGGKVVMALIWHQSSNSIFIFNRNLKFFCWMNHIFSKNNFDCTVRSSLYSSIDPKGKSRDIGNSLFNGDNSYVLLWTGQKWPFSLLWITVMYPFNFNFTVFLAEQLIIQSVYIVGTSVVPVQFTR